MAKITSVDYEAMPNQAKQMRNYGKDLNTQVTTAYQSVDEMRKSWYGKRYNSLVQEFNKIIPNLNELLDLVVGEIPFAIETVANNYALADKGAKVTSAVKEAPRKITNITESKEVGMRFLTAEVSDTQTKVTKNFQTSKDIMNTIEGEYKKINWSSEAADTFRNKFTTLKNSIVKSFEDINSQFTQLMNQTKDDIQATENANTVQ